MRILFRQYCPQVYNEMPFLREALNDMAFIPQHTELESYYYLPPPPKVPLQPILTVLHEILLYDCFSMNILLTFVHPQPKPFMKATLPSVTFVGLAECLINIYETVLLVCPKCP